MSKVKEANAVYTGGNIWLFYGELDDGNYFLTDDNGWTQILNENPSDFDESLYYEWQNKHMIYEMDYDERIEFCDQILDYIIENPEHNGGMTETEIEAYRNWFKVEEINKGLSEKRYIIHYSRDNKQIKVVRNAEDAIKAVDKLCDQYGWRWKVNLVDGDTSGVDWCEALVDTDGGINYSMRIIAFKED